MRSFLIRTAIFASPFLLLAVSFLLLDPFQVVHPDEPVESHNPVQINVDYLATETYLRNREELPYDAFIFGSSRTLAFRTAQWRAHLGDATPLRYNANAENLFGILGKLRLIDQMGDRIRHALLLVDYRLLQGVENSTRHLYIKHPRVSGESWGGFYMAFFSAWIGDFFFVKFIDYTLFGRWRSYMRGAINKRSMKVDPQTNDIVLASDEEDIARDPDAYYSARQAEFDSVRLNASRDGGPVIGSRQRALLEEIAAILEAHGARTEVVVSPNYDQVPIHPQDLQVLRELFGAASVHDYSGVNDITTDERNYYEPYHFRPEVGARILREIYGSGPHPAPRSDDVRAAEKQAPPEPDRADRAGPPG